MLRKRTSLTFWSSFWSILSLLIVFVQPAFASGQSKAPEQPRPAKQPGEPVSQPAKKAAPLSGSSLNRVLPGQFGPQAPSQANLSCSAPIRIMPLGDSITKGSEGSPAPDNYIGGYRQPVYLTLQANGKDINFVGSLQTNPTTPPFDYDNEGHSGYKSTDIAANVYSYLSSNPADIVLLHIGTNDVDSGSTDPSGVITILDNIDKYASDHNMTIVKVVAARIIIDLNKPQTTQQFNDALQAKLQARLGSDHNLILAYFDNALSYPGDLTSDGLHPNKSGYLKMANVWENALSGLLNNLSCFTPLTLTKSTSTPLIHNGSSAQFHITVANTGKTTLYGVSVSDAQTPGCARGVGDLAIGASASYDCSSGNIKSSFTNVARASGTVWSDINLIETGSGSADVHVLDPQISVSTTAQPPIVHSGDSVSITVTLQNTGDSTVDTVGVNDIIPTGAASPCNLTGPSGDLNHDTALQTSEVWTYTCSVTAMDNFTNTATVNASDKLGGPVTGSASTGVTVVNSSLALTTTPSATEAHPSDLITFTTTIKNMGNVDLSNLSIHNALVGCQGGGSFAGSGGILHPGKSWDYACSISAGTVDLTDTVSVTATDTLSRSISASSSGGVDVIFPMISLDVESSLVDVSSGNIITYTYVIANKGKDAIENVTLIDNHCSPNTGPVVKQGAAGNWLTPGSIWAYTCAKKLDGNTVSIVSLSGLDKLGSKFEDTTTFVAMRTVYIPLMMNTR